MSSATPPNFPSWFRIAACSVPLVAFFVAVVALAYGASIQTPVMLVLVGLTWNVILRIVGPHPRHPLF